MDMLSGLFINCLLIYHMPTEDTARLSLLNDQSVPLEWHYLLKSSSKCIMNSAREEIAGLQLRVTLLLAHFLKWEYDSDT